MDVRQTPPTLLGTERRRAERTGPGGTIEARVVAIVIAVTTVVGVEPAGEVIIRRVGRNVPILILDDAHPGEIVEDRHVRANDLVLPEEEDTGVMRLRWLRDDE
jgi:hypothetical protein